MRIRFTRGLTVHYAFNMKTWKLTARKLCRKPDMVVPDEPVSGGAPLGMQVILYPRMQVQMMFGAFSLSPTNDDYFLDLKKGVGFVCVHGLAGGVPFPSAPNKVVYVGQADYNASLPTAIISEDSASVMATGTIRYRVPWTAAQGKTIMFYNLLPELNNDYGVIFEDVKGNKAYMRPFIALNGNYNVLLDYMCPEIKVELVSSTDTVCRLRLTKSHAVPATSDFANISMDWRDSAAAAGGLVITADPADPGNTNKIIVECGAGVYRFGARASHTNPARSYSGGCISVVVEVK